MKAAVSCATRTGRLGWMRAHEARFAAAGLMPLRRRRQRILITAIVTMVMGVGALYLPATVSPVDDLPDRLLNADGRIDCGSLVIPGSTDDSCEDKIIQRLLFAMAAGLVTVLLVLIGAVMWLIELRRAGVDL